MTDRVGTDVRAFFARFPDERTCIQYMFETRWGSHTPCPRCGRFGAWYYLRRTKTYQHVCGGAISVLNGTAMFRSRLSLMAWFYTMLLMANSSTGMRSTFISRHLGIGIGSAVRMTNRIRLHMAACARPTQLGGPAQAVYVDETLVRYAVPADGSDWNDAVVMGLACDGQVISGIIPDRRRSTVVPIIERFVHPDSTVVTDAHPSYSRLAADGWRHKIVNHSVFFSDFAGTDLNAIETYWRVLKRSLSMHRTIYYHNLWLYLAEVELRYNLRRSPEGMFEHLIREFPAVGAGQIEAIKRRYCW